MEAYEKRAEQHNATPDKQAGELHVATEDRYSKYEAGLVDIFKQVAQYLSKQTFERIKVIMNILLIINFCTFKRQVDYHFHGQ